MVTVGITITTLADQTCLLCRQSPKHQGVHVLLRGHSDLVNAVKFFPTEANHPQVIFSGSVDKTIRVWREILYDSFRFETVLTLEDHERSVICFGVFEGTHLVASGSADATIRIWSVNVQVDNVHIYHVQTIQTEPRYFPLALALHSLGSEKNLVLAAAGTKSIIQIYVASRDHDFYHQATLTGHEGWIRSLAFSKETSVVGSDLILASASQDKYIRLWRIRRKTESFGLKENDIPGASKRSLSSKEHKLAALDVSYSLTFEALLLGHEDWIYTLAWRLDGIRLLLLSASSDNSLAIWQPDERSGVWVCTARLGEISAQKGSTTATGSSGGFWIGLWSPNGKCLASLGKTGSWRLWKYRKDEARWIQSVGTTGHTRSVTDISWSKDGSYLLSTSSDQTTRLHAPKLGGLDFWYEMSRPQIHGHDLNCVAVVGDTQFVSGADEKLLRVFNEPRAAAILLSKLCGIQTRTDYELPHTANIPVLGLSNTVADSSADDAVDDHKALEENQVFQAGPNTRVQDADVEGPPYEDQLAKSTLWPEREKLYGHGYEISAVAASKDGSLVATSCRASSFNHAGIRLYRTRDWREVQSCLKAHSLTVTSLCFSKDDRYLLSVGRDRQWTVFERDSIRPESYSLKFANPKGHTRMILDACWAPTGAERVFATAGRDKSVKIWRINTMSADCTYVIAATSAVTAIDIFPQTVHEDIILALGTETGDIILYKLQGPIWSIKGKWALSET